MVVLEVVTRPRKTVSTFDLLCLGVSVGAVSACFRLVHTGSYLVVLDVAAWSGSGSHHLTMRTISALLLQYFESAVPTDHRADSLDRECFADNWQAQSVHVFPVHVQ